MYFFGSHITMVYHDDFKTKKSILNNSIHKLKSSLNFPFDFINKFEAISKTIFLMTTFPVILLFHGFKGITVNNDYTHELKI